MFSTNQIFQYTDACVQPVLTKDNIQDNPQVLHRKMISIQQNGIAVPSPAPRFDRTPSIVSNYPN